MLPLCSSGGGNSDDGLEGVFTSWRGCIQDAVTTCALE